MINIFKRFFNKKEKQLTLKEKWELDVKSFKDPNYNPKIGQNQCYDCIYKNTTDLTKCPKIGDVPK